MNDNILEYTLIRISSTILESSRPLGKEIFEMCDDVRNNLQNATWDCIYALYVVRIAKINT